MSVTQYLYSVENISRNTTIILVPNRKNIIFICDYSLCFFFEKFTFHILNVRLLLGFDHLHTTRATVINRKTISTTRDHYHKSNIFWQHQIVLYTAKRSFLLLQYRVEKPFRYERRNIVLNSSHCENENQQHNLESNGIPYTSIYMYRV